MTFKRSFLLLSVLFIAAHGYAQPKTKSTDRADFSSFKKQIMELKEYQDEKKKAPKLQKQNGQPVKVVAVIDKEMATDEDAPDNMLTGYIKQVTGTDSSTVYEIQYDRVAKKIVSITPTGDGSEPDDTPRKHGRKDDDDDNEKEPKEKPQREE